MGPLRDDASFIPATPMAFPHPAAERDVLLPEEKQSFSTWVALRGYLLAASVFAISVLLAGAVIVETKPAIPDPNIELPRAKIAAVQALLDSKLVGERKGDGDRAFCIYGSRDGKIRENLRAAFPVHAETILAEDCDLRARKNHLRPTWLHIGRVTWPNRSYAVVVFAMHGRGEIILHKGADGYEVHKVTWPVR